MEPLHVIEILKVTVLVIIIICIAYFELVSPRGMLTQDV